MESSYNIRKLQEQMNQISVLDSDFFMSKNLINYLIDLGEMTIRKIFKKSKNIKLNIFSDNKEMAYAVDNRISINYNNEFIKEKNTRFDKFMLLKGFFVHELCHVMWTDSSKFSKYYYDWKNGNILQFISSNSIKKEMENYFNDSESGYCFSKYISELCKNIFNILEDAFIENLFLSKIKNGSLRNGLIELREYHKNYLYEFIYKNDSTDSAVLINEISNVLLLYAKYNVIEDTNNQAFSYVMSCNNLIKSFIRTSSIDERANIITQIIEKLWIPIKDNFDENLETLKNNNGEMNNPNDIMNTNKLNDTNGNSDSYNDIDDCRKSSKMDDLSKSNELKELNKIEKSIKEKIAKEISETNRFNEMKNDLLSSINEDVKISFNRKFIFSKDNETALLLLNKEIEIYSTNVVNQLKSLLENKNQRKISKGLYSGNQFSASKVIKNDYKFFNNIVRDRYEENTLAVSVLLDLSGSMHKRGKIFCAKQAALLLYKVFCTLGIPFEIIGHNCPKDYHVLIHSFASSDSLDDNDELRIASINPYGCNHDGAAINVAINLLSKRKTVDKLLFVISDGQPNDSSYYGNVAFKDIQEKLDIAKEKKIHIIGVAIDEDKDVIKNIYTDGFVDITNLSNLSKTLLNIIISKLHL